MTKFCEILKNKAQEVFNFKHKNSTSNNLRFRFLQESKSFQMSGERFDY